MLLYHRIAEVRGDPQCLAVAPDRFADHLDVLRHHAIPTTLEAMVERAEREAVPAGSVAITFDDGYADNLHTAVPLLTAAGLPATVFVSTAPLESGHEFWWDELERALLRPGRLPRCLRLSIGDHADEWDLAGAEEMSGDDAARLASWTVLDPTWPTPRHRVYLDLCGRLQPVTDEVRERVLNELAGQAGQARDARTTHRPVSPGEVIALANSSQITIGSHTHSHPSLAGLPPIEQRREVAHARQQLESLIGRPVTAFAYPFGGAAAVSAETVSLVKQAGLTLACSTDAGTVRHRCDRYRVPRLVVRNWTRAEFQDRWLSWVGQTA